MADEPTAARKSFGDVAPALAEIADKVLFGDVWQRPGLVKHDRGLVTITSLISLYRTNELPFHLKRALENGVTRDEIIETITHLAFYAGWPPAMAALQIARRVFEDARGLTRRDRRRSRQGAKQSANRRPSSPHQNAPASRLAATLR
jgi:4-carboxymuconolactone decarboxylase